MVVVVFDCSTSRLLSFTISVDTVALTILVDRFNLIPELMTWLIFSMVSNELFILSDTLLFFWQLVTMREAVLLAEALPDFVVAMVTDLVALASCDRDELDMAFGKNAWIEFSSNNVNVGRLISVFWNSLTSKVADKLSLCGTRGA